MNLTIKKQRYGFNLFDGNQKFCSTECRSNAILIQKIFAAPRVDSIEIQIPQIKTILQKIIEVTGVDLRTNLSQQREIVNIRFIYCKIAINAGFTLKETGQPINRNHDTVLNAVRKFNDYYQTEPKFRELYHKIKN